MQLSTLRKPLHLLVLFALILGVAASSPQGTRLDLKVSYTGPETVDAAHPITVMVFDGPDFSGGSKMVAAGHATRSGKTLTFENLPETVYLVGIFDPSGSFTGLSGMIPGSAVGVHTGEDPQQPAPVTVGKRTKVEFSFDGEGRLPGDPDMVVPPKVRGAENGIVEIRTYTVREGKREAFIDFFVNRTLKGQKRAGLRVVGQFRSLENSNQFVWIRAYESQAERVKQLRDFYLGPDWIAVQDEAAELIADTHVMIVEPTKQSRIR